MKVEEIITNKVIEKLEQGVIPWHKPWKDAGMPKNLVSKKEYKGINVFVLGCQGFASPYWLTFAQCKALKGSIKAGSHGTPVVFWKINETTTIRTNSDGTQEEVTKKTPLLRYYLVFNVEQCTDIDESKIPTINVLSPDERLFCCETLVAGMPVAPEIVSHDNSRAYYSPVRDIVNVPRFQVFTSKEEYYSTLFHELVHSTKHEKRLNRKDYDNGDGESGWSPFGSEPYAREELVAEMGASFLCGHCQIEQKTLDNSAAYIQSWLNKLRDDRKLVVYAAAQAQKAVDFILNRKNCEA